jgi:uncharacterized protein
MKVGDFEMRIVSTVTLVLLIIGGLNWGLVGLFGFDLVAALFDEMSALSRIVYTLVGASALWQLVPLFRGDENGARSPARS